MDYVIILCCFYVLKTILFDIYKLAVELELENQGTFYLSVDLKGVIMKSIY
jgi:hypothetical protein